MQSNQKASLKPVAPTGLFGRTRAAVASAARSSETRQQVIRELSLLSDRALADLGLYRSDISSFARTASAIPGAEPVLVALLADVKAWFHDHGIGLGHGRTA